MLTDDNDFIELKEDYEKGVLTNAAMTKKHKVSGSKIRRLAVRFEWVKYKDRKLKPTKIFKEMAPVIEKMDAILVMSEDDRRARGTVSIDDSKGWLAQINDAQSFILDAALTCLKDDLRKPSRDSESDSLDFKLYGKLKVVQDIITASKQNMSGAVSLMDRHEISSEEKGNHLERVIAIPTTEKQRIDNFHEEKARIDSSHA